MMRLRLLLGMALTVQMIQSLSAADLTLKISSKEPPNEVGDSIKKVLDPKAIQVLNGDKPSFEFWFRREVPLTADPASAAKALDAVGQTTLLGVAIVGEGQRDSKDNEIAPGTYTIRFGLQPQDGDHLGTSEFRFFAVLIPAKADPDLDGITKYKPMVKASGKGTPSGHPVVLSLRPPSSESGETPALTDPAPGHKAIRVKLPAKGPGAGQQNLLFELVYRGKYKA